MKMDIDEAVYNVDVEISQRYIGFSSELLRISLLAIAGYGTLITTALKEKTILNGIRAAGCLNASMIAFAVCAGATLVHRYFATDALAYLISHLRAEKSERIEVAQIEYKGFVRQMKTGGISMMAAAAVFAAAVLLFALGIMQLIQHT